MSYWISIELELDNLTIAKKELVTLRRYLNKKFKAKITNFVCKGDDSLRYDGVELTGDINHTNKKSWLDVCAILEKLGFIISEKTGLHIHVDMRKVYDKLSINDQLKFLQATMKAIYFIQERPVFKQWKHLSTFHDIYYKSFVDKLAVNAHTRDEFVTLFLRGFRINPITIANIRKELAHRGEEHAMWLDISPLLRYIFKVNSKWASGSYEYRCNLALSKHSKRWHEPFTVDKFTKNLTYLLLLSKYTLHKIKYFFQNKMTHLENNDNLFPVPEQHKFILDIGETYR